MIDQATFDKVLPVACQWAQAQEEIVLARGIPLGVHHLADARSAGVQDPGRVRILVVDRIPFPDSAEIASFARRAQIITDASRAVTLGYGIMIRADAWGDRELLVHNLVHVAQHERNGADLEQTIHRYLLDRRDCAQFSSGSLEDEARSIARQTCKGAGVARPRPVVTPDSESVTSQSEAEPNRSAPDRRAHR